MGIRTFTNNASSTLASGITNVATSLTVASGEGARFPAPTGGQSALCTLESALGVIEVVRLTARTGDICTVTRGQEGTAGTAFSSGARFELRVTADSLNNFAQKDGETFTGTHVFPATVTFNGVAVTDYARLTTANTFSLATGFGAGGAPVYLASGTPGIIWDETDAAATNKRWAMYASAETFRMSVIADASGSGQDFLSVDRTGTVVDSVNLQATSVQANGSVIHTVANAGVLASGTYSPTLFTGVNSGSLTLGSSPWTWLRVGNTVTVAGFVQGAASSGAGLMSFGVSIPVASNFGTASNAAGTAAGTNSSVVALGSCGNVASDPTNDRLTVTCTATGLGTWFVYVMAQYQVI